MKAVLIASILFLGHLFSEEFETCEAISINLSVNQSSEPTSAITYALDGGRFGDELINYIKALWISHKYGLKFLYRPFSYSDQLQCSLTHPLYEDCEDKYKRQVLSSISCRATLKLLQQLEKYSKQPHSQKSCLYIISFHTPIIEEWEDEDFREMLSDLVKPIIPIEPLPLPESMITVAVHVRTGIGYDNSDVIKKMPTKFPNDSYYIKSLLHIAGIFEGQPLYIYIFTDHPQPATLRDKYIAELKNHSISNDLTMECRLTENRYDLNVLEDFFQMIQFDCIIRPDSSYSRAAAAISGPIVEISPPRKNWMTLQGVGVKNDADTVLNGLYVKLRPVKGKKLHKSYIVKGEY